MYVTSRRCAFSNLQSQSKARRASLGVSLIEVLVSIVISSIGLLALAGVNAASMRYTKMSQYRGTATLLASDMGERIRANKAAFVVGNYDYDLTDFAHQATAATLPTDAAHLCADASTSCLPADIADLDLRSWRLLVRSQLPEGSVLINRDGVKGADVFVVWRDPAVASTDEAPAAAKECPNGLNLGTDASIRCSFVRVNL